MLQFDNKISLGHLISVVAIALAGLGAYFDLRSQQEKTTMRVDALSRTSEAREVRVRSVEIAQASQSSDLRAIQIGIAEIKAQLTRMQQGGR